MPIPYLTFDGTAAEALDFYAKVLGGEIAFSQSFGESPMRDEIPAEHYGRIMHATLNLPDGPLMASDAGPWAPYAGPVQSCSLSLVPRPGPGSPGLRGPERWRHDHHALRAHLLGRGLRSPHRPFRDPVDGELRASPLIGAKPLGRASEAGTAGVDTVAELATRRADNLTSKIAEVSAEKQLTRALPSAKQVQAWIDEAKTLPRAVEY